jgi:phospholipase C
MNYISRRFLAFLVSSVMCLSLICVPSMSFAQSSIPIQHLIFIIQENHSFDNYFGTYAGANGIPPRASNPINLDVTLNGYISPFHLDASQPIYIVGDELPPGVADPLEMGDSDTVSAGTRSPFHLSSALMEDIGHSWQAAHIAYDNGKMDGFVFAQDSLHLNGTIAMGYYTRSDLPYYYDYADNYVLEDNFFSSLLGPSLPNHLYIASGTSGGIINNEGGELNKTGKGLSELHLTWLTLAQELSASGVSWAWYTGETDPNVGSIWNVLPLFSYFQQHPEALAAHVQNTQSLVDSIQEANLPAVSWITPGAWKPPSLPSILEDSAVSEHPPARLDAGMDYVASLVNDVMQSQYWPNSAIIITWDDYGGFYDHVPPPQIDAYGEGFRVPTLIISPYSKHHYVDSTMYEFGSLLSLAETVFHVSALTSRDENANNMINSFDFQQAPQPPLIEPANFLAGQSTSPQSNGYPNNTTGQSTPPQSNGYTNNTLAFLQNPYFIITAATSAAAIATGALLVHRRRWIKRKQNQN